MLDYNTVVTELQNKITEYTDNTQCAGNDSGFYSECADRMQGALDEIQAKGATTVTQQDLIVGWQALRDCTQKRTMKVCMDNWGFIVGGAYLIGVLSANIYYKLRKKAA